MITRGTEVQADPAYWAQLDHDSVELVRRARGYLDEIAPALLGVCVVGTRACFKSRYLIF